MSKKSVPERPPNQHLNPQILTNVSRNLFDGHFRNSAFLIHCLIVFYANPPATVRFWAGDSSKNRRKKRHRNAPPKQRRLGGESDKKTVQKQRTNRPTNDSTTHPRNIAGSWGRAIKTSCKKTSKSSNQRINDAPPKQRRLGGESENFGSKHPIIDPDF